MKFLYGAWRTACKAAGFRGMLIARFPPHGHQASGRSGCPPLGGDENDGPPDGTVYRRYAIADRAMLQDGGAKLQTFHDRHASAASTGQVIPSRATKASS
jgi:hypothetical protein